MSSSFLRDFYRRALSDCDGSPDYVGFKNEANQERTLGNCL